MKDIIYKLLWATIEDYVGLWEIYWELNSLLSDKSKTENKETVKKILRYFLDKGLVRLYFNKWGKHELTELDFDEAVEVLNEEKYWEGPEVNNTCLKIGSTEKGEKYYNKDLISDVSFL